ncbi:hypothetical protein ACEWY4_002838 [Coilia grayii]|uniref:Uncharacterized protein n=1 Tax=Coilia grayii TaxID=363190 RepID=A0ABD1KPI5_9TELE
MATHVHHGSGETGSDLEKEECHITPEHSGLPESPQGHSLLLRPESLSADDQACPILTSRSAKGCKTDLCVQAQSSPGPLEKGGKIPGYGKFAAFLQEEENDEDIFDEEENDPYASEEEVEGSGIGQLESSSYSENSPLVHNRKGSFPIEDEDLPARMYAKHKGEAKTLMGEDAHIPIKREMEADYSAQRHAERRVVFSSDEMQQRSGSDYDRKEEARISLEAQTHAHTPGVHHRDQEVESISDERKVQDEKAHFFTQQQESTSAFTQEQEQTHTSKNHKKATETTFLTVNAPGLSCEMKEGSPVLVQHKETALTETIQQGELLLHRLHMVQQRQQSQEESEEFPVMANQQAALMGNTQAREWGNSLACPDVEDYFGEGKDRDDDVDDDDYDDDDDDDDKTAGLSHGQPPPQASGEQAGASVDVQLSDGDDQSDSGVSADLSPCCLQEPQASAAVSPCTATARQLPPGDLAQATHHQSTESEESSQPKNNGGGPKAGKTEQISIDPPEGPCYSAEEGEAQGDEGQGSAGKRTGEGRRLKVNREEELARLGRVLGEYSAGCVRKFKERRMLFEAFQQVKPAETKAPLLRPKKKGLPTSISDFYLSSVSTSQAPNDLVCPSVSVMERARSLEQLSQAQEPGVAWNRDRESGNRARPDAKDRIVKARDITLVNCRRPLSLSYSSESLYDFKGHEEKEERVCQSEEEEEEEEGGPMLHRENPFFRLRPALALRPDVARDIQDTQERERELRRLRKGLHGGCGHRRHSHDSGAVMTRQADSGSMAEGDAILLRQL